jgi:hypothetical protein
MKSSTPTPPTQPTPTPPPPPPNACHLRLETLSQNHKNQSRQQLRNPYRNRTSSGHKSLALRTSTKCLQIHSSKKIWKTITDLYLIVLHPEAQNYQRIDLPDLQSEIAKLFQERLHHFTAVAATATAAERK